MAITTSEIKTNLKLSTSTAFATTLNAGASFTHSGIYKCAKCGKEIAANKHENTLPPHYPNEICNSPLWYLYIAAEN